MLNLLVIDHNQLIHRSIEQSIKKSGLQIAPIYTKSAAEGLKSIKENKPDIILMDLSLSDIDSKKMCRSIRDNPGTKFCGIIFMSVSDDPDEIEEALKYGADSCIIKPVSAPVFIEKIQSVSERLNSRVTVIDVVSSIENQKLQEFNDKLQKVALTGKTHLIINFADSALICQEVVSQLVKVNFIFKKTRYVFAVSWTGESVHNQLKNYGLSDMILSFPSREKAFESLYLGKYSQECFEI